MGPKRKPKPTERKDQPGYYTRLRNWWFGLFERKESGTPIKDGSTRFWNMIICHFRGIFGCLVTLCVVLSWWHKEPDKMAADNIKRMWAWMFLFFFFQPVSITATSFIPIFFLPMTGILDSDKVTSCYANENIMLYILTSMLLLLLNQVGVDKRIALWFLCSGDVCQFSGKRLIFKCCTAGFFLSMISNRLIAAYVIIQYVNKPLMDLQNSTSRYRASEPDYNIMRSIVNSATATSCAIGSIAIVHGSPAVLAFRAMYHEAGPYQDIFNYLQYSAFAFPFASVLNIIVFSYYMFLLNILTKKPMSASSMTQLRNALLNHKKELPKTWSLHELLAIFFTFFYLVIFFTRWCTWFSGWSKFSVSTEYFGGTEKIPSCLDATTAAIFVVVLHILPNSWFFTDMYKIVNESKKSKVPPLKRTSAILWWRYVDRNLNYAYIFLIGSGVALLIAAKAKKYDVQIAVDYASQTDRTFLAGLCIICLFAVGLANTITGVAGVVILLPWVICLCTGPSSVGVPGAPKFQFRRDDEEKTYNFGTYSKEYTEKMFLCALAVGIGSSFGFMWPFMHTPAYFAHFTGKVSRPRMVKYGLGAAVLSWLFLWLAVMYYAPCIFGNTNLPVDPPKWAGTNTTTTTTEGGNEDDTTTTEAT